MKLTIPYENCDVLVIGTYEPGEHDENGEVVFPPEFYIEEFVLMFGSENPTDLNVHEDDLPLGMVSSGFYTELEQRAIEQCERLG